MSIAFRKVWRDLWNYKGRTLLVVVSIAVGVMALGMTTASNVLLKRQMALSRAASRPPHARLTFSTPLSDDVVEAVAHMPEVADAEGWLFANVRWRPAQDAEWQDAVLTAPADFEHQKFDLLELRTGHWPASDEVDVEYHGVGYYGVPPIGGTVYFQVNDHVTPLKMAGTLRDPSQLPPPYNGFNQAAFYVDRDTMERLIGTRLFNRLRFSTPHYSREGVERAVEAVQEKLKRLGVTTSASTFSADVQDPTGSQTQEFLDGLSTVLTIMAVLSLGLSVTLVINTIHAIVAQQITQIGIMKTIGGLYPQIVTLYLTGVLVYGLLSLVLAVPLGAVGGYYLSAFWLTALNVPVAPFEILPQSFSYQALVGLVTPLLAGLWPVMQGVGISVRQAIAAYGLGTGRYGAGRLDRLMGRIHGLPRLEALALRNTFRRVWRVALTELTLISAGAIFMMVVATSDSFQKTIDSIWESWGFDVLFVFGDFQRVSKIATVIAAQPNVNQVELWTWMQASAHQPGLTGPAHQNEIQLRGIPDGSTMFAPTVTAGRLFNPADGHAVVFNQKLASDMGVSVGDQVVIDLGGAKKTTWTIVGTVFDIGVGGQQNTAFMRRTVLNADLHHAGEATVAQIGTVEDTLEGQDALKKRLKSYFETQGIDVSLALGQIENKQLAGALFGLISGLLQIMTFLVAIVGGIGLSGTLSINVMERRREIGVMRAVGASSGDVARIFMGEGLLLGVLSWAQAVPLSMVGARFFVQALGEALNFPFFYRYTLTGTWLWLAIVIILSLGASWLPARRATQISVRESLAYE